MTTSHEPHGEPWEPSRPAKRPMNLTSPIPRVLGRIELKPRKRMPKALRARLQAEAPTMQFRTVKTPARPAPAPAPPKPVIAPPVVTPVAVPATPPATIVAPVPTGPVVFERDSGLGAILIRRILPAIAVLLSTLLFVGWFRGPDHLTAAEVGVAVHDRVVREVIERTHDYSWTVGKLDCVELKPGRGNCLADARSNTHRADHVMVAVAYRPGSHGQLDLAVKLP
jgi:hypothetical protein